MKKIAKKYWISILFSLLILVACFISLKPLPPAPMSHFDKVVHFFMFFFLSGFIYFENTHWFKRAIAFRTILWGSLLFPIFYGGLTELLQNLTPHRVGDWGDFLWDSIGATVGFFVALLINNIHIESCSPSSRT